MRKLYSMAKEAYQDMNKIILHKFMRRKNRKVL